jgi:tetratricopeptide (TPR) repeat protein
MRVELPPEPVHFVNRHDERARALRAVTERGDRTRPLIVSLSGPAGLGKSELAYLIARTTLDLHPDGVRTVDLDDFRFDGAVDPGEVLAHLLESLGVEPAMVAPAFKARCRQYWARTADSAFVLVVDNVRYASELTPLLPASGRCTVLVASHGPLYDLADGTAVDLPLGPLEEAEARELLGLVVRDDRLAADPAAVRALLALCEGLPTALHIAGRWIRRHRLRPLAGLIGELDGTWAEQGLPEVERVWDLVYATLDTPAATLYRLLPHLPAASFTPDTAVALLGAGPEHGLAALEELDRAGLLDRRDPGGRLRLPGPLHAHALRRSRRDAPPEEAARAEARLLRWTTRQAQRADLYAAGPRLVVTDRVPAEPGAPDTAALLDPVEAADEAGRRDRAQQAVRWLATERHTLLGCLRRAHDLGHRAAEAAEAAALGHRAAAEAAALGHAAEVVALSEALWTYALDHPGQSETVEAQRLAVASAVRAGRPAWLVRTRCQLARALWETAAYDEAAEQLDLARAAVRRLTDRPEDRKLAASALEFQGLLQGIRGDWAHALPHFAASRDIHRAIGNAYGAMLQTYRLGEAYLRLAELDTAHTLLTEARTQAAGLRRERMTRRTGFALAEVLRAQGRYTEARPLYEQALAGAQGRGSGHDRARSHDALAALEDADGRPDAAREHRAQAAEIRRRNGLERPER